MRNHYTANDVQAHVERLTAPHFAILTAAMQPDASYTVIAERLSINIGTAKSRLHRARAALGKLLIEAANPQGASHA